MIKHIPPLTISSAVPGSHSELYVSFSPLIKSNNEAGLHSLRNIVEGILETDSRPCINEDSTTLHVWHYGRRCIAMQYYKLLVSCAGPYLVAIIVQSQRIGSGQTQRVFGSYAGNVDGQGRNRSLSM